MVARKRTKPKKIFIPVFVGQFVPIKRNLARRMLWWPWLGYCCDFLFRLQPPPPHPDKPPARPTRKSLISVHFGPFRLRFGPFRVRWLRLAPFRVCFGSVSGPFRVRFGALGGVGVGWGRGEGLL